jgi:hypothetical protein
MGGSHKMKRHGPKFVTPEERLLHFRGWIERRGYNLTVRWLVDDRTRYIFELNNGKQVTRGLFYAQAYAFLVGYAYGVKETEVAGPIQVDAVKRQEIVNQESATYLEKRSCLRKLAHASRDDAHSAMLSLKQRQPDHSYEVYKCRYCTGWHVGHSLRWPFVQFIIEDGSLHR